MKISDLDHPCKNTCSGWMQGYERGLYECREMIKEVEEFKKEIESLKRTIVCQNDTTSKVPNKSTDKNTSEDL